MSTHQLPPFSSVLKSREVEDPVNRWLHRPLAYAFVALVYRTPITPNQITLLALLVGFAAAACFIVGTRESMVLGGLLLWSSAILDGADGILARAKRMFSDVGRALDGASDMLVAIVTVGAAFYHLWLQQQQWLHMALIPFAFGSAMLHVYSYDYYKEAYLDATNPGWDGEPERAADIDARLERLRAEKAPWIMRFTTQLYVDLALNQRRLVRLTNPRALREHLSFPVSPESVRIHRQHNAGPMKLWAAISLAPHSYLISICAIADRLDIYLWIRVLLANALFVVALLWQRRATRRTEDDLARANLAPRPFAGTHVVGASPS
jgi:phosphatidylglycerophosphate synthase